MGDTLYERYKALLEENGTKITGEGEWKKGKARLLHFLRAAEKDGGVIYIVTVIIKNDGKKMSVIVRKPVTWKVDLAFYEKMNALNRKELGITFYLSENYEELNARAVWNVKGGEEFVLKTVDGFFRRIQKEFAKISMPEKRSIFS